MKKITSDEKQRSYPPFKLSLLSLLLIVAVLGIIANVLLHYFFK